MSIEPLVCVEGLTKDYPLGAAARLTSPRRLLTGLVPGLARRSPKAKGAAKEPRILRALSDLTLDARPGEVLGIIGRNGAGKSTLLKILARVQPPTSGRVTLRGRLVALLELGVAFAPDLTVSETIVMFGLAARVPRKDVRPLEDRIVAMAELEEFRETPLRNCPAGSFVRLCFAALVSFPAEIVLADEVLAVGDSQFRQACEQRIGEVAASGGTVLFVSHDLNALRRVCTRIVWLDRGVMRMSGDPETVLAAYVADTIQAESGTGAIEADRGGRILDMRLLDERRAQVGVLQLTEPSYVECAFVADNSGMVQVELQLWRAEWHVLSALSDPVEVTPGLPYAARVRLPGSLLNDGAYEARFVLRGAADPEVSLASGRLELRVINGAGDRSVWADWTAGRPGLISPRAAWSIEPPAPIQQGARAP